MDAYDDNRPGAYGDSCDIMSAQNFAGLPVTFGSKFGTAGPGLNALNRESLGWIPNDRILYFLGGHAEVDIAPLDNTASPNALMLKTGGPKVVSIVDGSPLPSATYITYTVEFRPKLGWDAGISADAVVIHLIREGDRPRIVWSDGDKQSWLPGDRLVDLAHNLKIEVLRIRDDKSAATLSVENDGLPAKYLDGISVKKTLAHKFDVTKGLRSIKSSPASPSNSLRGRLLDNPPQFAP